MSCCQTMTVCIISCLSSCEHEHKKSDVENNIVDNELYQISMFHLLNQFENYASSIIEVLISYCIYSSDLSNI